MSLTARHVRCARWRCSRRSDQQLQLGVYVQAARRQGATEEEIREVLRQVAVYAGFPNAWNGLATMKAALERFDET